MPLLSPVFAAHIKLKVLLILSKSWPIPLHRQNWRFRYRKDRHQSYLGILIQAQVGVSVIFSCRTLIDSSPQG